jgi:hypothetical protein
MSYYAKYLKYKKKYLEIRGQLAGGIDDNTLWYISQKDNEGLFNKNNNIYYMDQPNRTRNLSTNYTAKYNGREVIVQPTEILFEDEQNKHLIVRGNMVNF